MATTTRTPSKPGARWGNQKGAGYEFFAEYWVGELEQGDLNRKLNEFNKDYIKNELPYVEDPAEVRLRTQQYIMDEMAKRDEALGRSPNAVQLANREKWAAMVASNEKVEYDKPTGFAKKRGDKYDFRMLGEPYQKVIAGRKEPEILRGTTSLGYTTVLADRRKYLKEQIDGKGVAPILEPDIKELREALNKTLPKKNAVSEEKYNEALDEIRQASTLAELTALAKKKGVYDDKITLERFNTFNDRKLNKAYDKNVDLTKFTEEKFFRNYDSRIKKAEDTKDLAALKNIKRDILKSVENPRTTNLANSYNAWKRAEEIDKIAEKLEAPSPLAKKPANELATLLALKRGGSVNEYLRMSEEKVIEEAKKEGFGLRNNQNPTELEKAFVIAKDKYSVPAKDFFGEKEKGKNKNTFLFDKIKSEQVEAMKLQPKDLDEKAKVFRPVRIGKKDVAVFESDLPTPSKNLYNKLTKEFLKSDEKDKKLDGSFIDYENKVREAVSRKAPWKSKADIDAETRKEVLVNLDIFKGKADEEKPVPVFDKIIESAFAKDLGKSRSDLNFNDFLQLSRKTNRDFKFELAPEATKETARAYNLWPIYQDELKKEVASRLDYYSKADKTELEKLAPAQQAQFESEAEQQAIQEALEEDFS